MVPYFQNHDRWVPLTWDYTPYFIWGSNIFFLGTMIFFFIDFPNVLESAHKWVQIDNEIVLWSGL